MIGRLRGRLAMKQPPRLLIDVSGVGYELEAPMSTFYSLPAVGEEVSLLTHLLVRDDAHLLYGFAHSDERVLFRSLLKVSGVGARLALAILSGMSAEAFAAAVQSGDAASLTRLPGIGKKTAERLMVEMRDRLDGFGTGAVTAAASMPAAEAASALVSLGYRSADATRMVADVESDNLSTEEIIRAALQRQAQRTE
ncbi:MAG: Holliday junction branch migration protein RuvA [Gammaproteobacteria bacterium]|nr:MAG: Holliday junction branch migration protein RuvA [Gammaproteobacteria bacterium]